MNQTVESLLCSIEETLGGDLELQGGALEALELACVQLQQRVQQALRRMHMLCLLPAPGAHATWREDRHFVQARHWLGSVALLHRTLLLRAAAVLAAGGRAGGASAVFAFLLSSSPGDAALLECLDNEAGLPEAERQRLHARYALNLAQSIDVPEGCLVYDLAYDEQSGSLLATDMHSGTLHVFDFQGGWLRKCALPASGLSGVAVDQGRWWVCDWASRSIFELAPTGEVLRTIDCASLLPPGFPNHPERIAVRAETIFLQCTRRAGDIISGSVLESAVARLAPLAEGWHVQTGEVGQYAIGGLAIQGGHVLSGTLMLPAAVTRHALDDLRASRTERCEEEGYFTSLCALDAELFLLTAVGLLRFDDAGELLYSLDLNRFFTGGLSTIAAGSKQGTRRIFVYQYTANRIHMINV